MQLTLITDQPTTTKLNVEESRDRGNIILDAVNATPIPLDRAKQPSSGAYLLLYHGDHGLYRTIRQPTHPALPRSIVEQGGRPIYAGSAFNLAARTQCHRLKLQRSADLNPRDFTTLLLITERAAAALYAEQVLIDEFQPVWNQRWLGGFGSKSQGHVRVGGQRSPRWNLLHASIPVANSAANATERALLAKRIEGHFGKLA